MSENEKLKRIEADIEGIFSEFGAKTGQIKVISIYILNNYIPISEVLDRVKSILAEQLCNDYVPISEVEEIKKKAVEDIGVSVPDLVESDNKTDFFYKLSAKLDELFSKGDRRRGDALVLNAFANIYLQEEIDKHETKVVKDLHKITEIQIQEEKKKAVEGYKRKLQFAHSLESGSGIDTLNFHHLQSKIFDQYLKELS